MLASKQRNTRRREEEEQVETHLVPSSDEQTFRTSSDDDELDEDRFESPEIMMNALFLLELTNPALKHALTEIEPLVLTRQLTTPRRTFEELYDVYRHKRHVHNDKPHPQRFARPEFKLEPNPDSRPSLFVGNRLPPLPSMAGPKEFALPTFPDLYQPNLRATQASPSPYDNSKWEDSSSGESSGSKKRTRSYLHAEPGSLSPETRRAESEILAGMGISNLLYASPYLKAHAVSLAMPLSGTAPPAPSSPTRKRRKVERKRATPDQVDMLEKVYAADRFPPTEVIKDLADKLEMKQQKVKNWFQNKRAKERRMGVELIPPANNGSRRNSPKGSSASASSSSDEGSSKIDEGDKQKNELVSA